MNLKMGMSLAIAASCFSYQAQAITVVGAGKITVIENGWFGEGMAIHTSNDGPSGCSAPLNDFAIDKNHPSYQELTAMALVAYTKNLDVEVLVDPGVCIFGDRTKVISIRLKK
ncbi:hypothetical protein [Xanthomonas sp. LF06-19]|uniref:hypothetical protein n=1 Tax=Xanthomonas sp. LF06-19 TaxID=3097551 RepID=UPI002A820138|nr:hypothetical protein [Xanthomonas sp. LF06-19]MDY4282974.1 hypothetical protein [Xanthomonas sp. LF06-19]